MRTLFFGLALLAPPFLKMLILRWFCGAKIGRGARIGWFSSVGGRQIEIGAYSEIRPFTLIRCGGDVSLGAYSFVSSFTLIYGSASFIVGNHSYVGPQCLINVAEDVRIGDRSGLGPRCMIMTHGALLPPTEGYWCRFAPVTIGDRAWIISGVFIPPGVKIGSDVFIGPMSVLTNDVPSGAVMDGHPAKRVTDMERLKRKMSPKRVDSMLLRMADMFAERVLGEREGVAVERVSDNLMRFRYGRREYALGVVLSEGAEPPIEDLGRRVHCLFLVNRAGWDPPKGTRSTHVFDLTTMRIRLSRDRLHQALRLFLLVRFRLDFEFDR